MFLSDNWVIFLKTAGVKDGTAAAVSQVEQMYASRCYQQSQGALACISCHGGHDVPTAGQAGGVFREKCLSCHTGDAHGCAADLAHRQAVTAEDSCIVCHMPKFPASDVHASQTDHRILRRASAGTDVPAEPVAPRDLKPVLFNEPGAPVDGPEWGRARGIYLAERAAANRNTEYAKEAVELLAPTVNESPNDVEGRYLLGRAYMVLGQSRRAIRTWEKVLAIQPRHEDVLEALAAHYHEANDLAAARRYYERLLEVNPGRSQYYGRLAHVLGQLGDLPRAIELAEKCLELNPSLMQTHAWLVEACLMNGDQPRAAAHAAILKRFQPAAEKTK
jgi:hypothetical protein